MNNNRLDIDTYIKLIKTGDVEKVEVAYNNYKVAKKHCVPFMDDLKEGLLNVNKMCIEAGMDSPFVFNYEDLDNDLENKMKNIKSLEAERDEARTKYRSIDEDIQNNPGLTYAEVKVRKDEAGAVWDEYNQKVQDAWYKYREAEAKKNALNKEEFNAKCDSFEYLKEMFLSNRESLLNNKVLDERMMNKLKTEMFGIETAIESLESKQEVIKNAEEVFAEISKETGIEIVYDNGKASEIKEVKTEEVKEYKEEKIEPVKPEVIEEELEEPVVEETKEIDEPEKELDEKNELEGFIEAPVVEKEPIKDNSKVPFGQKFKVTNVRMAKAAPFIKSTLLLTAISGVCLASWGLCTVAIGAGLGVGAQAGYRWLLKQGALPIPEMENEKNMEQKMKDSIWIMGLYHSLGKPYLDRWKNIKMRAFHKKEEVVENVDELDELGNNIEEAMRGR